MSKIDLKKDQKQFYNPPKKNVELVDVPPMSYLMVDGQGDPNTARSYHEAMEALYTVAYTLKFASKKAAGIDYVVMPLEGLWWAGDMAAFDPATTDRDAWQWTSMIRQPDHVTAAMVEAAIEEVARNKDLVALPKLRFETYDEGLSAQVMHLGPYADEGPTIARLHAFIEEQGCQPSGKHHEIYLGDPRRTAPEKLKTVIRQPVKRVGS